MIYDSLDTIPYKIFFKIADTGNVKLLSDTEENAEVLLETWSKIYEDHISREKTTSAEKKAFRLSKEIDSLEVQYKVTLMACDALRFDFNEELCQLLTKDYGFKLRTIDEEVYYQDLLQIEREAKAFKVKIGTLKKHLPAVEEGQEFSVDDIMASYCSILGYQIGDFNSITYTAYYGYEKQVHLKIESLKKQESKSKK